MNLTKTMMYITEMKDGNPFNTVDLDRDSKRYVHIRLKHISKTYDENDEVTEEINYH